MASWPGVLRPPLLRRADVLGLPVSPSHLKLDFHALQSRQQSCSNVCPPNCEAQRRVVVATAVAAPSTGNGSAPQHVPEKEAHKLFDQVTITVRAGDGGNGAVLAPPRPPKPGVRPGMKDLSTEEIKKLRRKEAQKMQAMKRVGSFKRDADGLAILPMGGHGGDIVVYADPQCATLLPLHGAKRLSAGSGGNVDSRGGLARRVGDGAMGEALRIPVPVGEWHVNIIIMSIERHIMQGMLSVEGLAPACDGVRVWSGSRAQS